MFMKAFTYMRQKAKDQDWLLLVVLDLKYILLPYHCWKKTLLLGSVETIT